MRKFNITVNGVSYEVEVEEIGGAPVYAAAAPAYAPAPAAPVAAPAPAAPAAPAPKAAPAPAAAPKAAAPAGSGEKVTAPMPGNILDVKVAAGQAVKKGDLLCVLEAMKMENEILAPKDGTIETVAVSKGATVATGDTLVTIA